MLVRYIIIGIDIIIHIVISVCIINKFSFHNLIVNNVIGDIINHFILFLFLVQSTNFTQSSL